VDTIHIYLFFSEGESNIPIF